MKRILIFSYAYFPKVGGAEVAVKEITDRISKDQVEFDMITRRFSKKDGACERIGNVNVHRLSAGAYFFPFRAYFFAKKLHAKNSYDSVWSIMANYAGFSALFFKMKNPDVPFLLTLQEGDPIDYIKHRVRFVYPIFKRIFTKADRIQAISHYLADFAREMGAKCPIEVIPNGVDVVRFEARDPKVEQDLKEQLGIEKNERVIITTSRLVVKNGVSDLIDAMKLLPEQIKLLILGTGLLEAELKAKVEKEKLVGRVIFLGLIEQNKIPQYLHISNIFCRPSLSEGMGNSFIEAMAGGIPVIATSVGGIPDFLFDGETGLFCKVNDPSSIAEKVQQILSDTELCARITQNARRMVSSNYDWNQISEKMLTFLTFL